MPQSPRSDRPADVAILTILPEAYEAVMRIFGLSTFENREEYQWTTGTIGNGGDELLIILGQPLDRENVPAATFTQTMIHGWHPRNFLLVDIGGGVKGRDVVNLGDVVTHTVLHYYDHYKVEGSGSRSPRQFPIAGASTRLRELSRRPGQRGDSSWIDRIPVPRPGKGAPKVLPGEMLVGGAIQSNSPLLLELLDAYPKVLAVEMEGVGAGRAVIDAVHGHVPEFLVIRGISDYCNVDQRRNQATRERWRYYAAAAAAAHAHALVLELLARGPAAVEARRPRFAKPQQTIDNLWEATRIDLKGREKERRALRERFSPEASAAEERHPHVIWGEAGMGKSSLALAIAEEVAPHYTARWWIDASDQLRIRVGLRELARRLSIPSASIEADESAANEVEEHRFLSDLREALQDRVTGGRVLLVLDNIDDAELKHDLSQTTLRYLPPTACDVLITSQSSRWYPVAPTDTPLSGLDIVTSARLIADESNRPELAGNEDVQAICREFAGRPLFLKQIAWILRDEDPRHFRRLLESSVDDALERLPGVEAFVPLGSVVYRMAVDRADRARPGSRSLLETIAFLSPEPVPLNLVHTVADRNREWVIDAALSTLTERSLLQSLQQHHDTGHRSYTLHRVIAAIIRRDTAKEGRAATARAAAVGAVHRAVPPRNVLRLPAGRQAMAALAPHVEAVAGLVLAARREEVTFDIRTQAAEACSLLGLYRRTLSEWAAAQDAHLTALRLSDPEQDPARTALRKVRLANVMRQRGHFADAQTLLGEAVPVLEKYGDPRDYAWALTVEARTLRARPDSAAPEALVLLMKAAELLEPYKDEGDPSTVRQISELHGYTSVINRLLSRLDAAELEAKEGLRAITGGRFPEEILQAEALPREPLLATHLRALGGVWRLRGKFADAMAAHQQAVKIFESVYGRDHTDVGRALDSLGRVQRECGHLAEALQSFVRAEEISDLQFGSNYAHAGTAAVNRALVHLEMRDAAEALREAERGFRIYCSAYGETYELEAGGTLRNESTVWSVFVRANALAAVGELEKARADHELVLQWRNDRYPDPHAHIASSHYALGDVLWKMADVEESLSHHRLALDIRERVFDRRPDYWLAQSQARLGTLTADLTLLRLAYDTFLDQLGVDHWRTREMADTIAMLEEERR